VGGGSDGLRLGAFGNKFVHPDVLVEKLEAKFGAWIDEL
jgi:hypothetical protein